MRQTKEQILTEFPSWSNHPKDIVQVRYGDIPDCTYNKDSYIKYQSYDDLTQRICCAEAYIYSIYGAFDIYKTNLGDIHIHTDSQQVLHGSISIPYRGKTISILLNLIYGTKSLTILDLKGTGKVRGFCNEYGQGSPCSKAFTEELEPDIIKKILSNPLKDYGYGVQTFMNTVRELYEEEPYNYIMERTFNM